MRRTIILTSIFPLFFFSSISIAGIYKWVDEEGRTHYGEKPPVEDASKVNIRDVPKIDDSLKQQSIDQQKLLEIYEEERKQKKEEKLKAEKEMAERKKQCQYLASELSDLKQGGVAFYDLDEKGERKYYSEAELAAYIDTKQKEYDKNCK
jgi:hypothetical protein